MKIIDLSQTNSVINCYMAQLRDVNRQTEQARDAAKHLNWERLKQHGIATDENKHQSRKAQANPNGHAEQHDEQEK